jgi:hypothetical protein
VDVAAGWTKLKQSVTFTESDSVAVIRDPNYNLVSWLPVFLNDWSRQPHVSIDGRMEPVEGLNGFERFEKLKTRKLFDTATGQMV